MKKSKPLSQVLEHLHYGPAAIGWPEHIAWAWHQRLVKITGALKDEQPKFIKKMKDHAQKIQQKGEKAHGHSNWVNPLGFSWSVHKFRCGIAHSNHTISIGKTMSDTCSNIGLSMESPG